MQLCIMLSPVKTSVSSILSSILNTPRPSAAFLANSNLHWAECLSTWKFLTFSRVGSYHKSWSLFLTTYALVNLESRFDPCWWTVESSSGCHAAISTDRVWNLKRTYSNPHMLILIPQKKTVQKCLRCLPLMPVHIQINVVWCDVTKPKFLRL